MTGRLRILRVHPSLDPRHGGIVSSLTSTTRALTSEAAITVLTSDDDPEHQGPVRDAGAEIITLPRRGRRAFLNVAVSHADLVVVEGAWQPLAPLISRVCRHLGVPYLYVPHGALSGDVRSLHPRKHLKKLLWWLLFEQRVMSRASATWFASDSELRASLATFPGTIRNGAVLPLCVDDLGVRPVRGPRSETRVVTAARLVPVKRIDVLLTALSKLPADWSLHVAGTGAPRSSEALGALADQLEVADRVTWHGHLDRTELRALLHECDVYVAAGIESFGMAVAEAMSTSMAIVVSDRVATSGWLPGKPWVVPYGDADALARSLREAGTRARSGAGAAGTREVYDETFSAAAFRKGFVELVVRVLDQTTAQTTNHHSSAEGKTRRR